MSEQQRGPRRRGGQANRGGRRPMSNMANGQGHQHHQTQAPPLRVATPPLSAPIPSNSMRFADLGSQNLLHPILLQTITEDLGFDHMMPVQEATLRELLEKRIDCLAQAKTGTGKTVAFLLPAIQTLINRNRPRGSGISLLVITPTRELAMQIAKEATALLKRLPNFKVSFAIGGTNKDREEKDILSGCNILIATPGRLYDHLSNPMVVGSLRNLDTLVLDEADRLLDMGFKQAIKDIVKCLPDKEKSHRQGMLFSATIAPHVQEVAHLVLSSGYKFISTIKEGDVQTHERVPQLLITVPNWADVVPAMVSSIKSECQLIGQDSFKTIVFAPTAALADFYGEVLSQIKGLPAVSVLHARVSQSKRTKVTNEFRESSAAILVATDVVARGMDFPNVSNVFQVGLPADKESYIHRLGRTARAGKEGRSVFILTEPEVFFPKYTLKEITFETQSPDLTLKEEIQHIVDRYEDKAKVYKAWLGYYKAHAGKMKWSDNELVAQANKFAFEALGSPEVPGLEKQTVGKMGLKNAKGLNIIPNQPRMPNGRGRGGGGGEGRSAGSGGRGGAAANNTPAFGGGSGRDGGEGRVGGGGRGGGRGGRGRGGRGF